LWLEWEITGEGSRLARFVIFVMHPEAMLYATRATQGRTQDKHLTVAARLGRIEIDEHFYEITHKPGTYGRLCKVEHFYKKELNREAIAQVHLVATVVGQVDEQGRVFKKRRTRAGSLPVFPGSEKHPMLGAGSRESGEEIIIPEFTKDTEQTIEVNI
jgi:hypothetical protein